MPKEFNSILTDKTKDVKIKLVQKLERTLLCIRNPKNSYINLCIYFYFVFLKFHSYF